MSNDVYIPFLVTGVFVFTFTQSSVMAGVRAISGNLGLVRALHFPRASLPISFALQQLQQLLFSMIVLFVVADRLRQLPGRVLAADHPRAGRSSSSSTPASR